MWRRKRLSCENNKNEDIQRESEVDFWVLYCIIKEGNTQDNTQVIGGAFMGEYKPPFTITNEISG